MKKQIPSEHFIIFHYYLFFLYRHKITTTHTHTYKQVKMYTANTQAIRLLLHCLQWKYEKYFNINLIIMDFQPFTYSPCNCNFLTHFFSPSAPFRCRAIHRLPCHCPGVHHEKRRQPLRPNCTAHRCRRPESTVCG